jgi:hypothetical protein
MRSVRSLCLLAVAGCCCCAGLEWPRIIVIEADLSKLSRTDRLPLKLRLIYYLCSLVFLDYWEKQKLDVCTCSNRLKPVLWQATVFTACAPTLGWPCTGGVARQPAW